MIGTSEFGLSDGETRFVLLSHRENSSRVQDAVRIERAL